MERLLAVYRTNSSTAAAVTLVLANLVPLAGVLFFGWNVWTIVIVYWLENGVVGIVNVFKIRRAAGPYELGNTRMTLNGRPVDASSTAGLLSFFALHYGLFWVVHGVFVLTLPIFAAMGSDGPDLGPRRRSGRSLWRRSPWESATACRTGSTTSAGGSTSASHRRARSSRPTVDWWLST